MIKDLQWLNDTFYKLYEDLKEAGESLAGNDEAIKCIREKILEQYELEYKLLDLKCRVDTEREIAKLEGRYDRLVPQRWKTRFLHRKKQNYAATLIDIEADEAAGKFFAECERRRAKERLAAAQEVEAQVEIDEEFEIVDDALEDTAELTQDEPQGESGNVTAGEPTAVQEQAQILSGDEACSAESDPCSATSPKSPQSTEKQAKKKGDKKNVREGDQAG